MHAGNEIARAVLDPTYPKSLESLPNVAIAGGGSYAARFARDRGDLARIQRLRFEVFNLELDEGLEASYLTGLDQDVFDLTCHHLMVVERAGGAVVGTYRMQTRDMARAGAGWYTDGEFDLTGLPDALLGQAVETGRACVAREHRNGRVLNLLWKGLAAYLVHNRKRYLFGCCSLTSQDPHVAKQTYDLLETGRFVDRDLRVEPLPGFACYAPGFQADLDVSVKLPPLFASYLKLGAKILGTPAIDREFKTIDFLTLLDVLALDPQVQRTFFPAAS